MTADGTSVAGGRWALDELARRHGVQVAYADYRGRHRRASVDTVIAVLRALGVALAGPDEAPALLRAHDAEAGPVLEPVLVRRGTISTHAIVLPAALDPAEVDISVRHEDGTTVSRPLSTLLVERELARPTSAGRGARLRRRFRLPPVPDGYHRLTAEGRGIEAEALVVASPARCPQPPRGWGVLAPLHALRTATDWGVGSYRDLGEVGGWVSELGGLFVGTLPVFAALLEGPSADPSPYRPASRLAWNELYLDVESLPELETCAEARRLLGSAGFERDRERLCVAPLADPAATMAAKRRVLELLASALFSGSSRWLRKLQEFVASRPELLAYARFRASMEDGSRASGPWRGAGDRRRGLPPSDDPDVRYHLYVQWATDRQLAEAATRAGLYMDLPVGVHPSGFDPWWKPQAFVTGTSAGAPPDQFFASGQSWGFSPLHPAGLREEGYAYLIAALRHAMRHAAVVRIDHVMGLHRLWFVPDSMAPREGVYVRYRAEELRAVVVLEAARAAVAVVGEDLGTVPAGVRRDMRSDGMLRSHVYQFAASAQDPFPVAPSDALASLGTHDLPPFAAWWKGTDIEDRVRQGCTAEAEAVTERSERRALREAVGKAVVRAGRAAGTRSPALSPSQALRACLIHLASGPARLMLVDPADLWGEREPQNRPGTGAEEANFLRRWAKIWPDDLVPPAGPSAMLRQVDRARRSEDGRGPATERAEGG
ncbi:MAG TPA: 4-alpha-glucanotransferase [Acidimicrobiales bacterium]|nr:4-alpha-glucanotransferase [Acidimicrobiales bacterium]HXZ62824.1 4-alpha-glucanotransferase [Acidimicrobiales bacterium]